MSDTTRATAGTPSDSRTVRRGWHPSLQVYLIGLLALCALIVAVAVTYAKDQNVDQAREDAAEQAEFQASLAAGYIEEAIALTQTSVTEIAANPGLSALFATPATPGCSLTFTGAGPFPDGHIDIIDRDGMVLCSSRSLPSEPEYEDAPWLGDDQAGAIHGPLEDPATGQEALVLSAPIGNLGVVATFLDVAPVASAMSDRLHGGFDVEFALTDGDGARLTPAPSAGTHIIGAAPVPAVGWSVEASVDEAAALADIRELNRQMLVQLLVGLLVVLGATYLVYRGVARPIRRLSLAVRGAMASDATGPVEVTGPAEVVALAEDFSALRHEMSAELTRRREAEGAARASEETYRALFDAHPVPMWVYDTETLAFLHVNDAAARSYGYSRDEFRAMTIRDIRPEEEEPALHESVASAGVMDRSGPWMHLHKDGTAVEVMITSHVVDFGDYRGRLVMAEDVTQAERTRRLLEQTQRMDSLGELAGGIAHDFNNVLSVMLNYADFAAEALGTAVHGDPNRWTPVLHDVEQIGSAGRRAAALTHQLLSFARGQPSDVEPVDLNDVISRLEDMLHRTLGEQTELQLTLAPGLWAVSANNSQIEQVLVNLAVNARDAMPDGGRLLIETANVDIDDHQLANNPDLTAGRYVRFRVSDTGVGMDAAQRDHAFEPFFTTKARGSGTGLGLAMVYGIISHAGGTIRLYSEPGMGTSITALLPATNAPVADDTMSGPSGRARGDETILVVEDDSELRAVTERILTRDGYRVLSAPDGPTALAMIEHQPGGIDLVLTDVVMPQMLGSELALRLQTLEPDLKVLFMSGYAPPLLLSGGTLPLGAPLIDKPFSAALLTAKVREVIEGRVPEAADDPRPQ